jgi:hypothetical protein
MTAAPMARETQLSSTHRLTGNSHPPGDVIFERIETKSNIFSKSSWN